jgi:hypothetical protein
VGSGSEVGVGGTDTPVGFGSGLAVGDGAEPVGLAEADGVGTVLPLAKLGAGLAVAGVASCRASAMIRADSGASWARAWPW